MTSKELVKRAIHFNTPERLPFTGSMGQTDFSGDTVAIFPDFPLKWWLGGGGTDEWGSVWEIEPGSKDMGQVKNIILENLDDFASVKIPDAMNPDRYKHWDEIISRAEKENKYIVACNGTLLFERAHFLYGYEKLLMDIVLEPEKVINYLRHISRYHLDTIRYITENFAGRIHGYRGTDDWGTQNAPVISPNSFVQVFKPVYREIFQVAHDAGMDTWMHSCGQNIPIIPHLIEAGLDVINLMQPNVFPIPKLAEFKGKICFEVNADEQTTLPGNDKQALANEVQALLDSCCTDKGGLIEMRTDTMFYDAMHVPVEMGEACHAEYRARDPFIKKGN